MKDEDILRRFGTLDPQELDAIFLPPGTCSSCGKAHWRGEYNQPGCREARNYRLTGKGWRAAEAAATMALAIAQGGDDGS